MLKIIYGDITKVQVDAIVNAANAQLQRGAGVCGAIYAAQGDGGERLEDYICDKVPYHGIQTGKALITPSWGTPAKYIIHAVGPIYAQYEPQKAKELLYGTYINALTLAKESDIKSIAFPLLSAGIYGYPYAEALQIAVEACLQWQLDNGSDIEVTLVLFR